MNKIDEARREGYTEAEIREYLAPRVSEALAEGYTLDEIQKHLGIAPIDNAAANNALASRIANHVQKQPADAAQQLKDSVYDIASVYAPVEGALNLATGAVLGFPAYLLGGIGGLVAHYTYSPDTDPRQIAESFAHTFTYNPMTERGKRFTGNLTYPLAKLMEASETAGKKVAVEADSPLLGALTESTISMLPAFLLPSLARRLRGETPTNSTVHQAAMDIARMDDWRAARETYFEPRLKPVAEAVQRTYERTGVDPQALRELALEDPTVRADLFSSNLEFPRALGGGKEPPRGRGPQEPAQPRGEPVEPPVAGSPEAAQAAVLSRLSVGEAPARELTWSRFYTGVKDDLYPIREIEKALLAGGELAVAESPYYLARLVRGAAGKATQFLDYGTFDWHTYKTTGPGLKQILEPHKSDLEGFRAYAVARRAKELHGRGLETGVDAVAADLVVASGEKYRTAFEGLQRYQNELTKYMKDSGLLSEEAYAAMLEANKDYVPFFRVFDQQPSKGAGKGMRVHNPLRNIKGSERQILDPLESVIKNTYVYTALAERNAVGRALGKLALKNPEEAAALGIEKVKTPLRPIQLEAREIKKMFDEFVRVRESTTTVRAETTSRTGVGGAEPANKVFEANKKRVMDALEARGFSTNEAEIMVRRLANKDVKPGDAIIEKVSQEVVRTERIPELAINLDADAATIFRPNSMRPGPDQIRYYVDGKPTTLKLPPEVAEAFNATDRSTANILLRIVAFPARTLRAGAILTPDFMVRNVLRDQLSAFTFSKSGYIPIWDMLSGVFSLVKKDGPFQNWLKSGGANSAMVALDREYLQQHIKGLNRDAGLMRRGWNVVTSPIEVLRITSELMENATRLGEFKRHGAKTKSQIQAAGFDSREVTLDFQRIGAQTRALNMISAFMNAGVEGLDRTARAFKDRPVATTAKTAAGITMPSILLWYANNSTPERRERYLEVPRWQRDLFWIVMTDDHIYRIPKPFELGVIFGSGPERILDSYVAGNPKAFEDFAGAMGSMAAVNVLPTGAVPILEQMTNHSFFTGNPLIPSRMENLLPEYQYNEYTSQAARALGSLIGTFPGLHDKSIASPIVIDNYVRGWTGGLGVYAEQALDYELRKAGVLPDPPMPLATLADIPVVKAFMVRYPSATAQSVSDFYARYIGRMKAYATFQELVQRGDTDAAMREIKIEPGAFQRLEGIHQAIGTLNRVIRMTYRDPQMTPEDKRQLIDEMYHQMILMAREGVKQMDSIDKVVE